MRRTVCSVFGLWLPYFQSSQHCREQWTGVMPSLTRVWMVYSKGLLAVFRVGKLSVQWKHISMFPAARAVCTRLNLLLNCVPACSYDLSVCMSLHSQLCVMSWNAEIQSMWLSSITCAWLARLFGTTVNEEGFEERKMYAQSVCVCVSMPEWNCVLIRAVWAYVVALVWHALVS